MCDNLLAWCDCRSKFRRAHRSWFQLMPQFQPEVPHPLTHRLPALLSPGRMAAPSVGIDLLVFIRERRLKGPTMQVQLDHIAGSEGVLREVREEQFVDDSCACHPNRTLFLPCGMGGHNYTAGHAIGSHRNLWAIVEAAHHLTFWSLLELIGRQVQSGRDARMVEQLVVFAAGDKREASHIPEHRSIAILPVEPEQRAFL